MAIVGRRGEEAAAEEAGQEEKKTATGGGGEGSQIRDAVGLDPHSRREEIRREEKKKRKEAKRLAAGGSPIRPRGAQGARFAGVSGVGDRLDSGTLAGGGNRGSTREHMQSGGIDSSGAPSLIRESGSQRTDRSRGGSGAKAAQLDLVLVSFRRLALVLGYVDLALECGDMLFPAVAGEAK